MSKIIKQNISSDKNNNIIIDYNIKNFLKEKPQKKYYKSIAFLGPKGSYSYLAVKTYINNTFFQKTLINISCQNFTEIFLYLKIGIINFAIIPIYNNCTGLIKEVLTLFKSNIFFLYIKKKFKLPIKHCLVTNKRNITLHEIKKVFSHVEPFKQCSIFMNKFPKWEIKYCSSSSFAMEYIKKSSFKNLAAIGNKISAKFYKLKIIKTNITNKIDNQTHFLVLGKK
ncbi:hypothetical protein GJU01_02240 (plasmid) [Enterobacteriaceae endosymbiont of Donacia vulgaris]|uniref:prephenate dehydratase domain-containing protein n=1 Tax=Enterobacteriaceae endosymbiont of Donacia vulgaris TaxID=2675789 RepID=UPI0014497C85|nr:prephenate dehydratase domain-containing protein [Enterobacteriaceae endosymbiont of Donacia vulgaris]QJC37140.1 hypothetical protein GJU01_02240 [Enterobacteriaceae endosymbiont of Donacia vulgaris]